MYHKCYLVSQCFHCSRPAVQQVYVKPFDLIPHPTFAFVLSFLISMSLVDLYGLTKVISLCSIWHFDVAFGFLIVKVIKFQDNQLYRLFILGFIQNEIFVLGRTIYKCIIVLSSLRNLFRNTLRFSIFSDPSKLKSYRPHPDDVMLKK